MKHIPLFEEFITEQETALNEELNESLKDNVLAGLIILSTLIGGNYMNQGVQRALDQEKPVKVMPLHTLRSDTPLARDTYELKVDPNQDETVQVDAQTGTITINTSDLSNINLKRKIRNEIKKINPKAVTQSIQHMRLSY
jgi:hypothetical protein